MCISRKVSDCKKGTRKRTIAYSLFVSLWCKDINQKQDGSQYRLSGTKLEYKAFVHSKKK